jgi:DNA gyrase/topoisomerase IV subunit B
MAQVDPNSEAMKQAFKEALAETLHEQRELLHEIFAEVLEDFALAEAIREGRQTERVERGEVFDALEDGASRLRSGGASCGISRRSGTSRCGVA